MCEAIVELFQDEYDAGVKAARGAGLQQGRLEILIELVRQRMISVNDAMIQSGMSKDDFMNALGM